MEPPLWQWAIAVQTDPNIFFHCRPVDGATVMAMGHPCFYEKIQPVDGATVVAMGHRCSNRSHHFLSLSIGFFTSIYKSVTPNYVKRDVIQQHSPTFRWNRLRLNLMFAKVTHNCDWDILCRHIPMYNYSLAYILAWMEFTTLIIMVGHLDPDTPLINVQVSETRKILWPVILISRISVP